MTRTGSREELLRRVRRRAFAVLYRNTSKAGISAATPPVGQAVHVAAYADLWTRDFCLSAVFMLMAGILRFRRAIVASVEAAAEFQAGNGMIPNFVSADKTRRDNWYLGALDPTLLWLILVHLMRRTPHVASDWMEAEVQKALAWTQCQELPDRWLLVEQPGGGIMDCRTDRLGHVMYSNVLWIIVKRLWKLERLEETIWWFDMVFFPHGKDFSSASEDKHLARVQTMLQTGFFNAHPDGGNTGRTGLGLSYLHPDATMNDEVDVFAHWLLILADVFDEARNRRIISTLLAEGAALPFPCKSVLYPPDGDDPRITGFTRRHPELTGKGLYWLGGWWLLMAGVAIVACLKYDETEAASELLDSAIVGSELIKQVDGDADPDAKGFCEFGDSNTGEALGVDGQTFSAASVLLGIYAMKGRAVLQL